MAPVPPPVHHYAISLRGGSGPSQVVRRHLFGEAQDEARRLLGQAREAGRDVEEGMALWHDVVGSGPTARVLRIDDAGLGQCDDRCGAQLQLEPGPALVEPPKQAAAEPPKQAAAEPDPVVGEPGDR